MPVGRVSLLYKLIQQFLLKTIQKTVIRPSHLQPEGSIMLLLSSKKWVSGRQTLGLNFKLNYAKNQSNSQNSRVLRKWKFDSLLHCEDIRVGYDLEEIISKILNLYCKKFSVNFVRWENFSGYATLRSLSFYRPQSMNIREDFSLMSNNIQNKNLRGSLQAKNGFRQWGDYWSLIWTGYFQW